MFFILGFSGLLFLTVHCYFPSSIGQNTINQANSANQINNTKASISNSNTSSNFILYENQDYNFKIEHPDYLIPRETDLSPNVVVIFATPTDNLFRLPNVSISVFAYPILSQNVTLADLVEIHEINNLNNIKEGSIKLINLNITEIAGNEAVNQVYYDYSTSTSMKINSITIIKNSEILGFLFVSQPGLFNTYLKDFQKMVASLEITSEENTNPIAMANKVDEYANYFASVTEGSVNLTKAFQDEIRLWQSGEISNSTMAELTSQYLKRFISQLQNFNNTVSPIVFEQTKDNLVSSFSNEIKSYEFFRDYLLTGNQTKNDISADYLSQALEDEGIAFKEYEETLDFLS
jgi:hypothetical protein